MSSSVTFSAARRPPECLLRAVNSLVGEQHIEGVAQAAAGDHIDERLEGFGRPVVVGITVCERQCAHAIRIERSEIWAIAAAVVTDQVDLVDVQSIEHFPQHIRIGGHGDVLTGCDFRVAMGQQIDCDAATDRGKLGQLVAPKMLVQQHTVDEQRNGPAARLGVADATRRGRNTAIGKFAPFLNSTQSYGKRALRKLARIDGSTRIFSNLMPS